MTGINDALDVLVQPYTLNVPSTYGVREYAVRLPDGHILFMGTDLANAEGLARDKRGVLLTRMVRVTVPTWEVAP